MDDVSKPRHRRWLVALLAAGPLVAGSLLVGVAALLFLAYKVLDPTPAKQLVLATGAAQGAYAEFGKRYAPLLRAHGLTVTLRGSEGSADNLALLRDPHSGVQAAFVQNGVEQPRTGDADGDAAPALLSLGSVAYEPLWLFYREDSARKKLRGAMPERLAQLAGWRINT
ncbi:MAG: C4-dicarboxylate ABC transporter substrate-binding protein, partial [Rubrivivax sp.]